MKRISGYKWAAVLSVLLLMLAAGAASAENHPVNPRRREIAERQRVLDAVLKELEAEGAVPNAADDSISHRISLQRLSNPAVGGQNAWSVSVLPGFSASQVSQTLIYINMRDYSSGYSIIYYDDSNRGFVGTVNSCRYLSAGSYRVDIYMLFSDGEYGLARETFTLGGTDSLSDKVSAVVSACRGANDWETALNLHDWLVSNVYYDPSLKYYGADILLRGYGTCDSYTKAYMMLCRKAGIVARRVTSSGHAWNAIMLEGLWYYVDCTWDDPTDLVSAQYMVPRSGFEKRTYFCLNEQLMSLDHSEFKWENSQKENCWALYHNYEIQSGHWKLWCPSAVNTPFWSAAIDALCAGNLSWSASMARFYWTENGVSQVASGDERMMALLLVGLNNLGLNMENRGGGGILYLNAVRTGSRVSVTLREWKLNYSGTLALPAGTQAIGDQAFYKSPAAAVVIPEGCVSIGAGAFADSAVRMVTIPSTVQSIGDGAFANCGRLIVKTTNPLAVSFARANGHLVTAP